MRPVQSRAPFAGCVLLGLAIFAAGSARAADVTLQGVTIVDGEATILFRSIEAKDTNLTHDELAKLFSRDVSPAEAAALVTKMKASSLTIPETTISVEGGAVTLHDFVASDIAAGHAGKITLAGIDGAVTPPGDGPATFHSAPLLVEGVDLGGVLAAARSGDPEDLRLKIQHVKWDGFDFTATDNNVPKDAVGGNIWRVHLGSLEGRSTFDGDVPLQSAGDMKNLTITAPPGSPAGKLLTELGYSNLDFGVRISGNYDAANRVYSLDDYEISEAKSGTLTLRGKFGSIDKTAFTGGKDARLAAILHGEISSLSLRFDDAGLTDKALAYFAAQEGSAVESLRGQWAAAATQFVPMLMGGDPAALTIAAAANTFIRSPKNLTISAKAKGQPIRFSDFSALKEEPTAILSRIDIAAEADSAKANP